MRHLYVETDLLEEGTKDLSKVRTPKLPLVQDHEDASDKDDDTVANVSEHDRKQERESDNGEETWVDLLVRSNTVTVHDGLEALGKLISTLEGWRGLASAKLVKNGRDTGAGFLLCAISELHQRRQRMEHTVAWRRANWIVVISRVGHQPSAIKVFRLAS